LRAKVKQATLIISGIIAIIILGIININLLLSDEINTEESLELTYSQKIQRLEELFGVEFPINFSEDELNQFSSPHNIVVVRPIFTQSAYNSGGFYDFFEGECDNSCLTVPVDQDWDNRKYTSSKNALRVFDILEWKIIDDLDLQQDPAQLENYERVILLHNEYVTKEMFDGIMNHPKVIYLYPNALYAEVSYNSDSHTITLIRGHGYPESSISNGFDWKFDNTHPYEYDANCGNKQFYRIGNGFMLDCYPEKIITTDRELIKQIMTIE